VKTSPKRSLSTREPTRRAAPEVVEKRRAARAFNEALLGGGARAAAVDGRTERRRKRLLKELGNGVVSGGKRELKPIDVLSRVHELLGLGEPLASIRKACPRPRPVEGTPEIVEGIRRIHQAYMFPAAVYPFVGLDADTLRAAGVIEDEAAEKRRAAKAHPGPARARPAPPMKAARRGAA
jgi:hypothetical protein